MRRPDKAGGKAAKATLKRRNAPNAGRRRSSLAADKETNVEQLIRERDEALEQVGATSEVLQVISSSPGELQTVFDTMLAKAAELCEASYGTMWLREGDGFRAAALHGALPPAFEQRSGSLFRPGPDTTLARIARTRTPIQVADMGKSRGYLVGDPLSVAGVDVAGIRTLVSVPMLKESELIGVISVYRKEVRPFTDKQIKLVQNFAAQAVIAIENTRLLNEQREALDQQRAIGEILGVIATSPSDVQPVLNSVAKHAARICEARFVDVFLLEGNTLRDAAWFGELARTLVMVLDRSNVTGRSIYDLKPVHVIDLQNAGDDFSAGREYARKLGHRTTLAVPLIKEGRALGTILVRRTEVRPFEEKHIALLTTFADQAAIAIENVRLFKAEQQRTHELTESLEQQTATSEVLKVIASSTGELAQVFSAMLANATRLCEASYGMLWLCERDAFRTAALHGDLPQAYIDQWRSGTLFRPRPDVVMARVAASGQPIQVADLRTDPSYLNGDPLPVAAVEVAGIRTLLGVPMFRGKELVGEIAIYRKEVKPFTDKQIDLVTNFAAQAVIAIENTRLLNELRRISPATDRHRRRAQSHQPLDFRSANRARYADAIGRATL